MLCIVFALVLGAPDVLAAPQLQSHRAIYELSLARARQGSGIQNVQGRLVLEWAQVCDGYILNQRLVTETLDVDGDVSIYDYSVASWESLDGLRFRYNSRNLVNGNLIEETDGTARMDGRKGGGEARFAKPEQKMVALPVGAIFPTEHTAQIIEAALAGRSALPALVFDGSGLESIYDTFAAIGRGGEAAVRGEGDVSLLQGRRSWPVTLSYFPQGSKEAIPDFEIGFRLYDNGIAGDIHLGYADFALDGRLARLQRLPATGC